MHGRKSYYLIFVLHLLTTGGYLLFKHNGIGSLSDEIVTEGYFKIEAAFFLLTSITLLFFTRSFLNTSVQQPVIDNTILVVLFGRIIAFYIGIFFFPKILAFYFLDLLSIILALTSGIRSYNQGVKEAAPFSIGAAILLIAFFTEKVIIPEETSLMIDPIQIGFLIEAAAFSFAIAKASPKKEVKDSYSKIASESSKEKNLNTRTDLNHTTEKNFKQEFPNEDSCLSYLEKLKWDKGFQCSKCHNNSFTTWNEPYSRKCNNCNYIESVTANTLFHRLRIPIEKAFYILYMVTNENNSTTMDELAEELNLAKNTCWSFKRKISERIEKQSGKTDWKEIIPGK